MTLRADLAIAAPPLAGARSRPRGETALAWLARLLVGGILGAAGFWWALITVDDVLSGYDQAAFGATLFLFIGWTFINVHRCFIDNVIRRWDNPKARGYSLTAPGHPAPIGGWDGQIQTGGWHRRSLRSTLNTRSNAIMKKHTLMHKSRRFRRFLRANKAVSALEYAILVGVIAVAVGAAIFTFGGEIGTAIGNIGSDIGSTTGAGVPKTTGP